MLGVVIAKVNDAQLPVDEEMTLDYAIMYPIKTYIDRFRSFLFDGVVGEAVDGRVIDLDWIVRL